MNRIKVIGIGSPFGNDRLGWLAVEALQARNREDDIIFLTADRPGMRLLELLDDTDTAILVDAIDDRARAGEIVQLCRADLDTAAQGLSSHAIGVSAALSLGQVLGMLPEKIVLFGICIDADDLRPIDPAVVQQLCTSIDNYLSACYAQH